MGSRDSRWDHVVAVKRRSGWCNDPIIGIIGSGYLCNCCFLVRWWLWSMTRRLEKLKGERFPQVKLLHRYFFLRLADPIASFWMIINWVSLKCWIESTNTSWSIFWSHFFDWKLIICSVISTPCSDCLIWRKEFNLMSGLGQLKMRLDYAYICKYAIWLLIF